MDTPEQDETRKPRTLYSGILKVLSGVDDIQVALTKWRLWFAAAGMILATGGVIDRVQGFPILRWVAAPILDDKQSDSVQLRRIEMKQDSTLREQAKIKATVDTVVQVQKVMADTLASVQKAQKKTQEVVKQIAILTKTDKTIIREREQRRGLFDIWGVN